MSTVRKFWGNVEVRVQFSFLRFLLPSERKAAGDAESTDRTPRRTLIARAAEGIAALYRSDEVGADIGTVLLAYDGVTVTAPVPRRSDNMADDCAAITREVERALLSATGGEGYDSRHIIASASAPKPPQSQRPAPITF